jgi:hypothetical protein
VRRHGTTGVVPFTRLPDEGLLSLGGKPPYDTSVVLTRQSTRDCLVSYAGNLYSVPAAYAQQRLLLRATEQGELLILTPQGHEVARHTVARGQQQRIIQAAHDQDLWAVTTPPVPAPLVLAPPPPHDTLTMLLDAPAVEKRPLALYDQLLEESV